MKHPKLVNFLILLWIGCYTSVAYAASLSEDVRGFDWPSLGWSCAAGLLGGALRTILTLATDSRIVKDIARESWKDAIVAMIGGMVAYGLVQGFNSLEYPDIPRDLRMLIIVGAGWSRGKWLGQVDAFTADWLANMRKRVAGPGAAPAGPSSIAAPLEEKP